MAIHFIKKGTLEISGLSEVDYQTCLQLADDIMGNQTPTEGHIYGVKRLRNSSATTWERTDEAVGLTANATHDGSEVTNDFDNIYPWSGIISFDYDSSQNLVTAYYGTPEFTFSPSDTNVNVFTKIPRFWYKRYEDEEGYEIIQIADYPAAGFLESKEFAVARYPYQNSTSVPRSISGLFPLVNKSGQNFQSGAKSMNSNMCLFDWRALGAIQLLYLVEYADYFSQSILGNGVSSGSKAVSGQLDSLGMKSGCLNNDTTHSVMYRGIEDIFGNVYQIIDGVNISNRQAYVCYDPSEYNFSKYDEAYTAVGYLNYSASGFISKLGLDENNPLLMLPLESIDATDTTYVTDYYDYASGSIAYRHGGCYFNGTGCGIFFCPCDHNASYSGAHCGARLLLRQKG